MKVKAPRLDDAAAWVPLNAAATRGKDFAGNLDLAIADLHKALRDGRMHGLQRSFDSSGEQTQCIPTRGFWSDVWMRRSIDDKVRVGGGPLEPLRRQGWRAVFYVD